MAPETEGGLRASIRGIGLVCLMFASIFIARPVRACAPAPPRGEAVRIADEEALIVWDPHHHMEHFVRRASFRTTGSAFGFIVPTPAKPDLVEVDNAIFEQLERRLEQPVQIVTEGWTVDAGCSAFMRKSESAAAVAGPAAAGVRVLEEKNIAGYEAVVIQADDASRLSHWLAERGFAEDASLTEWLEPYVARKWVLTAFKIASPNQAQDHSVGTSAVRMSFKTDRPFYPYREPSDQRQTLQAAYQSANVDKRMLRLFFAAEGRFDGALETGEPFPGKVKYSDDEPFEQNHVFKQTGFMRGHQRLTIFEDDSNPRPGTADVFFDPAVDDSKVAIPPIVVKQPRSVFVPIDLIFVVALAGGAVAFFARRMVSRRNKRGRA